MIFLMHVGNAVKNDREDEYNDDLSAEMPCLHIWSNHFVRVMGPLCVSRIPVAACPWAHYEVETIKMYCINLAS
jgi:hypothetical protein